MRLYLSICFAVTVLAALASTVYGVETETRKEDLLLRSSDMDQQSLTTDSHDTGSVCGDWVSFKTVSHSKPCYPDCSPIPTQNTPGEDPSPDGTPGDGGLMCGVRGIRGMHSLAVALVYILRMRRVARLEGPNALGIS